jgi:glycine cleavage system H protein
MTEKSGSLAYRRARFGTRLPTDRLYTRSHYWLLQAEPGLWRVGFTAFATRMLGDIVEYQFDMQPGNHVALGQKIGWVEGFKAVSDIYSVAEGAFAGANEALLENITLLESDPYERGWLYALTARPEPDGVDVHGYVTILDATIDKMLAARHEVGGDE